MWLISCRGSQVRQVLRVITSCLGKRIVGCHDADLRRQTIAGLYRDTLSGSST